MIFKTGNIVIYRSKCAVIAGISGDKIEIKTASGDSKNVRTKDIEFLHPGNGSASVALPPPEKTLANAAEVAELMESENFSFADFTDLAFGEYTASTAWSTYLLLQENCYFSGSISAGVTAKSATEVAATLAKLAEKTAAAAARNEFLERIRSGSVTEADRPLLRDVESVAFQESENSKTLRELGIEALPEKAQQLLLKLGIWDYTVNPWPRRFQVDLADADLPLPALPVENRVDLTNMVCLAIDDADSHDPDDAISFDNGLIWVHVADPAAVVTPESALDAEAAARGSNLYIPEKISHMLPLAATQVFGLGLNAASPALSFALRITDDGQAELEKMVLSTIKVTRMNYDSAMSEWDNEPLASLRTHLDKFQQRRAADGALLIDLPEVKIKLAGDTVQINPISLTPVRELVANAMLACGSAVAKYTSQHDIPMPYAVQPPPDETGERSKTLPGMFALRKACQPSLMTTLSGRHSGLALEPYCRITSPLRRYGDLLAHQQLRRVILQQELLTGDYIEGRITLSEVGALARRKLERQCNEYWTLVYFAQHPDWSGEAVPVYRQDDRLTWLIPAAAYEYKNRFGGKIELGTPEKIRLNCVEPATLTARFMTDKS